MYILGTGSAPAGRDSIFTILVQGMVMVAILEKKSDKKPDPKLIPSNIEVRGQADMKYCVVFDMTHVIMKSTRSLDWMLWLITLKLHIFTRKIQFTCFIQCLKDRRM